MFGWLSGVETGELRALCFRAVSDKELKRCSGGRIETCEASAGEVVNERAIAD